VSIQGWNKHAALPERKNIMRIRPFFSCVPILSMVCIICPLAQAASEDTVLLFSFFRDNGQAGLYLATSEDGLIWEEVRKDYVWLAPKVGESVLMRDPCVSIGADGLFHMVWTPGWQERGIGHASSKDLIHWSDQQYLPVMMHEPTARNAWAPEMFYDEATSQYYIFWATTIPGRFPETEGQGDGENNHRIYYTATKDFKTFSETELFYDPGFNVIDSTVVKAGERYVMFLKNETLKPEEKNIRIATAKNVEGPWSSASPAITGDYWAEGPSAIFWKGHWYVYFDKYMVHQYGALRSADLKQWEDISSQVSMPEGIRHGTVFTAPRTVLEQLRAHAPE
jgi:hypothetical protein